MKKILMIVDVQNGFMNHANYRDLSERINKYIENNKYDLYVFTKYINDKNSLYEKKLNSTRFQDVDSQSLCVKAPSNSLIFEKHGYGLKRDDLNMLKEFGVDKIDICGLQTDACVYAISFQLWDSGIYPNILINYTATDPQKEKQAKQMLIHQFGSVDERL